VNITQRTVNPIIIPIRPALGGKNTFIPGTDIKDTESPALMNVRFHYGQLQSRNGFGIKYRGLRETPMSLSRTFASDGTLLTFLAIDSAGAHQSVAGTRLFMPIALYDVDGEPWILTGVLNSSYISLAVGEGTYTPHDINAGTIYPATGYGSVIAFTNQMDGVCIIIPGSTGDPLEGEELDGSAVGTVGARCVAFFGNRLIIGGTEDSSSEILWSVDSEFENLNIVDGAGSALLGNETERIQNMLGLGEYLAVYKERSIYLGRLTGATTPAIMFDEIPSGNIGLAAPLSVASIGESHVFLGNDDVYLMNQNGVQSIGASVRDEIWGRAGDRGILRNYVNKVFGITVQDFNEYWLFTPTGKIPNATNLMTNALMDEYMFIGTTTEADATVSAIPSAAFDYIRIGDPIRAGHDVTPGTTVISVNTGAQTLEMSAVAIDSTTSGDIITGNTDTWEIASAHYILSSPIGGNFGGIYTRFETYSNATANTITTTGKSLELSGSGIGKVFSILTWLGTQNGTYWAGSEDTDATIRISVTEQTVGSADIANTTVYREMTIPTGTDFAPYIFSWTITDATCRKCKIVLSVASQSTTTSATLNIDAIQLIDMSGISPQFYYTDPLTGYIAPGYLGDGVNATLIPLITDTIGPWMCDTVWIYNWQHKAWSTWSLPASTATTDVTTLTDDDVLISNLIGSVAEIAWRYDDRLISDQAPTVVIVPPDAQMCEIGPQYAWDWQGVGSYPILSYWQSKDFNINLPNEDKTVSRVTLFHDVSHVGSDIQVSVSTDGGMNWVRQIVPIRVGHSETFADFFVTGPQARFEVRATTPGFRFTGFSLKLIPRGEVNNYA
jgi:hypothetical protein